MKKRGYLLAPYAAIMFLLLITGCSSPTAAPQPETDLVVPDRMQISSPSFAYGEMIPTVHTCDNNDLSPQLEWQGFPAETRSLVLIVEDPDAPAGTWVHWVLYDIPPSVTNLPEGIGAEESIPGFGTQGSNDFGNLGYGGPCPPGGNPHRYFFRLYALDTMLELDPGAKRDEVVASMEGHILDQGELMGTYGR